MIKKEYPQFLKKQRENSLALHCFSPTVMIATFLIEVAGAIYIWWRYKSNSISKIMIALLVSLAVFQIAEYNVCEGWLGMSGQFWSRLGFISISLLPALGIHLIANLSKKSHHQSKSNKIDKYLVSAAYGSMAIFVTYFLFGTSSVNFDQCLGNYVIFSMNQAVSLVYAIYYYGWILTGLGLCFYRAFYQKDNLKSALRFLGLGYAVFIVPTTIVNIIEPSTIDGIPSIMCGFAVLLAVALVFKVAPKVLTIQNDFRIANLIKSKKS